MSFARSRFSARRPAIPAPFTRARWRELVDQLRDAARQVLSEGRLDPQQEVAVQAALQAATAGGGTPVEVAGAGEARRVLLSSASGFLRAPADGRSPFARVLLAAADLVDGYLAAEATAVADRTWKRHLAEE